MDVSVVVPIYNGRDYIDKCCSQLAAQSLKSIEIILVDDGSTDGSAEVCDSIASRLHNCKVVHQSNQGVSAARNRGISIATGNYIGFVDVDDEFEKDMFECLFNFASNSELDVVSMEAYGQPGDMYVFAGRNEWMSALFNAQIRMSACNKLFKRRVLGNDIFPVGKRIHEDLLAVYTALADATSVGIIHENKYHYIHREGSSSRVSRFHDKYLDAIKIADWIYEDASLRFPELMDSIEARKARTYLRISKIYYLRESPEEYRQEIALIKQYLSDLDRSKLKIYFKRGDLIRYNLYLHAMPLFMLLIKTLDKK